MTISVKQMIETADAAVPRISPAHAREMIAKGNTLVVDVRDAPEVEKSGKIAGSVHVSRGMLEFRADPQSPYHDKNFAKDKALIVYCASGGRSALAGKALKDMGYVTGSITSAPSRNGPRAAERSTSRSNPAGECIANCAPGSDDFAPAELVRFSAWDSICLIGCWTAVLRLLPDR